MATSDGRSDQVSGDTGRTERLRALSGCGSRFIPKGEPHTTDALYWAANGCDDCLDLLARALAPEPSGPEGALEVALDALPEGSHPNESYPDSYAVTRADLARFAEAYARALAPKPEQSAVRLTLDEWGVPDAVEPPNTAVAPEPSGVPPEVKDALDNFAAVMQVAHPGVGERQRRQRAARDAVLSAIGATTEVERVARAIRQGIADTDGLEGGAVLTNDDVELIVARVVARLSGATHE